MATAASDNISRLSPEREARIRSATPSEAAIAREMKRYGISDRNLAIRLVLDRRVATAIRHDAGEHYGAATYGKPSEAWARKPLSAQQLDVSGAGFTPTPGWDRLLEMLFEQGRV